jgi:hypothetical protein
VVLAKNVRKMKLQQQQQQQQQQQRVTIEPTSRIGKGIELRLEILRRA